jgi:hypothetical protein
MSENRNPTDALEAFIARKNAIDEILDRLQKLSYDFFFVTPDDVHWGHVGMLESYLNLLRQVSDAAFHEDEYSKDKE